MIALLRIGARRRQGDRPWQKEIQDLYLDGKKKESEAKVPLKEWVE